MKENFKSKNLKNMKNGKTTDQLTECWKQVFIFNFSLLINYDFYLSFFILNSIKFIQFILFCFCYCFLTILDVPMSSGVSNIRSKGNLFNCYEFEWDPIKGAGVYVIVSSYLQLVSDNFCLLHVLPPGNALSIAPLHLTQKKKKILFSLFFLFRSTVSAQSLPRERVVSVALKKP